MTSRDVCVCVTKCAFQDPFGDVIKKIMNAIHAHAELSPTCDLGSQNYEQWVVQTERKGERNFSCSSSGDASCLDQLLFLRSNIPGLN